MERTAPDVGGVFPSPNGSPASAACCRKCATDLSVIRCPRSPSSQHARQSSERERVIYIYIYIYMWGEGRAAAEQIVLAHLSQSAWGSLYNADGGSNPKSMQRCRSIDAVRVVCGSCRLMSQRTNANNNLSANRSQSRRLTP